MKDTPLLEIENLAIAFGTAPPVVQDVSFRIGLGETFGVVGESGSGKSLSAFAVLGLLPPGARVLEGSSIRFEGRELVGLSDAALRPLRGARIAMVFQDPMVSLTPTLRAGAQVAEAVRQHRRLPRAGVRARVAELFTEVGLDPALAGRYPHQLSGGQQQRVMIASALAGDPALLLADEPTTALDATVQAQVLDLLDGLVRRRGLSMLFVSHDLAVVARMARRVAVMQGGRLVEQGPVGQVLGSPQAEETRALLAARRGLGCAAPLPPAPEAILRVEELAVDYPGAGPFARPVRTVSGVSLAVAPGRVLGLVGESGSGKTTVAKALVGLVRPAAGRITLDGQPLPTGLGGRRQPLAQRVQIVFQNPYGSLSPRRTIAATLAEPLELLGVPAAERKDRAAVALQEVGLPAGHLARFPHQLSGGQRQRIAIARALLAEPSVLICDEVVSALDMATQLQVLRLLREVQARRRLAMLFITHDLEVLAHLAQEVVVMRRGRVVEAGPTGQVLGAPLEGYTRELVAAMPRLPQADRIAVPV
ncbi:ABC transporter ATP-binding protein [Roseomonas eburnea]|uniref:ABC transporter ATP-binding protein n=1 Tax=Neoroseomonas eburnea TaxID=1346889 RepID=A0A9X9XE50_9PROT|nr:ABC transporter ATP-binding protein [Neoroseomonas eburnea]MBR0681986.1 ABC transporter ATP-binding protein [Neoroseomonas eburnea]